MKTVSVIIPTYKNRGGLVRSIESALGQDYAGLKEIIVVDDNDPLSKYRKDTERLMSQFSKNLKVVYIKHDVNKNGAAARNTGIKASSGDYIALLDDDDIFLQGKITKQVSYLEEHKEYDAVYCLANRNGKRYGESESEGDCTKELLLLKTNIFTPCQMFRRDALLKIRGYDESLVRHQDYDLLLRFFHYGFKIGCCKEVLTEIGMNEGENIPRGKKLEEMKSYFFEKFMPYIEDIDNIDKGFKNRVLAKHYAGVFLSHIKSHDFFMAFSTFCKYFFVSPKEFSWVINQSLIYHIKG